MDVRTLERWIVTGNRKAMVSKLPRVESYRSTAPSVEGVVKVVIKKPGASTCRHRQDWFNRGAFRHLGVGENEPGWHGAINSRGACKNL